jgi:phosphoglycerate dehydrogenase-like enzyme
MHRPVEVLVTWPDYATDAPGIGAALREAGLEPRLAPKLGHRSPGELRALARRAAGAIVSTDPFDAAVLEGCPELRVIARVGVGVDSIDLDAATARGIAVTVTPGANEVTVADHAVALILAAIRRICMHDAAVRRGEWSRTGEHAAWLLSGKTVGLVGYGRTGRLVARRLRGFDVRLLVSDPVAALDDGVEGVTLPALLAAADVVSLHVPLCAGTRDLIGAEQLALMRSHAVLVNTSRGGVVDERALADALRAGRLRAAALDVFADEPPAGSPLLTLPNVTLTPHVSGLSTESIDEMTRRATASVLDVLGGRAPADLANPAVLAGGALGGAPAPAPVGGRDA